MKFPSSAIASSVIPENAPLVRDLLRVLRRETELHRKHVALLAAEEASIVSFQTAEVAAQSTEREAVVTEMEACARERAELMKLFPEWRGKKLTELIRKNCHPHDTEKLLLLIEEFKGVVQAAAATTANTGQLTQFALNLVNGSLSIFKSASNNVVRSYTPTGQLRETVQPAHAAAQSTLREV